MNVSLKLSKSYPNSTYFSFLIIDLEFFMRVLRKGLFVTFFNWFSIHVNTLGSNCSDRWGEKERGARKEV